METLEKTKRKPMSEEHKRKLSDSNRGKHNHFGENNPNWRDGATKKKLIVCSKCSKKFETVRNKTGMCASCRSVVSSTGVTFTEERKNNISKATMGRVPYNKGKPRPEFAGEKNPNYQGGVSSLNNLIRTSLTYKQNIRQVLERDNFTCQECNQVGGKLHVDHIKPFAVIVRENKIENLQEAIDCFELWDFDNLRTLCFECHKKTDTYMSGTCRLIEKLNLN